MKQEIVERIDRTIVMNPWKKELCLLITKEDFITVEKHTPVDKEIAKQFHMKNEYFCPWGHLYTYEDIPMEVLIEDALNTDSPKFDWNHA